MVLDPAAHREVPAAVLVRLVGHLLRLLEAVVAAAARRVELLPEVAEQEPPAAGALGATTHHLSTRDFSISSWASATWCALAVATSSDASAARSPSIAEVSLPAASRTFTASVTLRRGVHFLAEARQPDRPIGVAEGLEDATKQRIVTGACGEETVAGTVLGPVEQLGERRLPVTAGAAHLFVLFALGELAGIPSSVFAGGHTEQARQPLRRNALHHGSARARVVDVALHLEPDVRAVEALHPSVVGDEQRPPPCRGA